MNGNIFKNLSKDKVLSRLLIIVFVSITFSFIFRLLTINGFIPLNIGYSDVNLFYFKLNHLIPYININIEYPVIIGLIMFFASRFNFVYYLIFHYAVFLVCGTISTIYLYKLIVKLNINIKNIFIYWAFTSSFFLFSYYNWDIVAVMFSILAIYHYYKNNDIIATIFVGLGCATKLYPALFILPIILNRRCFDAIKIITVFIATLFVTNIYFIIRNFNGWYYFYQFNNLRKPNPDSIWGIVIRLFPNMTVKSINLISLIFFLVTYITLCLLFRKKGFILLFFAITMLFIIFNKVFSPQYIIWILPFLVIYSIPVLQFKLLELSNLIVLFMIVGYILLSVNVTSYLILDSLILIRHIIFIWIFILIVNKLRKNSNNYFTLLN
jgi:uncharacterized membrane protein